MSVSLRLAPLCLVCCVPVALAQDPLPRTEIVKRAKPATALVDVKSGTGTAFCVHPSGLFLTNEHVVKSAGVTGIALILDAGLKTQRIFKARVIRSDKDLDLALLQVEGADKLPALPLGSDEKLTELTEVIAFGFPFGKSLAAAGEYPAISVSVGNVAALRQDKEGKLHRIQLDAVLNPGNSGGPVVDPSGKVIGVVVAGIKGAGINIAIPVSHIERFAARPEIVFTAPAIERDNLHKPADFTAQVVSLLGGDKPHELELILSTGPGSERRFPMKAVDGKHQVTVVPLPAPEGPELVRVTLKFEDGAVTGLTEDRAFALGIHKIRLSDVRKLKLASNPERPGLGGSAKMSDGRTIEGRIADFENVAVKFSKRPLLLELKDVLELTVNAPEKLLSLSCQVVARQGDKEVARLDVPIYFDGGGAPPDLANILADKFLKPPRAAAPVSYIRAISSKGDYIGQGRTYNYAGAEFTLKKTARGVHITVDGFNIDIGAPNGAFLAVGEFPNAKRHAFSGDSPGFDWHGKGRGSNRLAAKFVVWELEMRGDEIVRLAVDFIQRSEETGPPLYGMIRFNSTLQ